MSASSRATREGAAGAQPLVSVIVSTRDRALKTQALLESLLRADGHPGVWEAIIADNDSTDETAQVLRTYADRYPGRIRYLYQSTRVKATGLNLAIRHACGCLIALLDDDVRVAPDWLSSLIAAYESDPDLAGFGGRVELFNPEDAPVGVRRSPVERLISSEPFDPSCIPVIGCNLSFRRPVFERVGEYDEAFGPGSVVGSGDDMDLLYRAYRRGFKLKYLPNVLVFHDHGRKPAQESETAAKRYLRGRGAFYLKYCVSDPRVMGYLWRETRSLAAAALRELLRGRLHGPASDRLRAFASGAWAFIRSRVSPPAKPLTVQVFPAAAHPSTVPAARDDDQLAAESRHL